MKSKNIWLLPTDKPSRLFIAEKDIDMFILSNKHELSNKLCENQHIYITSDEEIKEGDYFIAYSVTIDKKPYISCASEYKERKKEKGKIILTTDQDLIKDGVQAIDDEFLEWFVKNPNCDEVEVEKLHYEMESKANNQTGNYDFKCKNCSKEYFNLWYSKEPTYCHRCCYYKIIIPKEEPKQETHICKYCNCETSQPDDECYAKPNQETLEEAAERCFEEMKSLNPKGGIREFIRLAVNFGAKWQQERMYSEEDVHNILNSYKSFSSSGMKIPYFEWFEKFKKK